MRLAITLQGMISILLVHLSLTCHAQQLPLVSEVESQPVVSNIRRLLKALDDYGQPIDAKTREQINASLEKGDVVAFQKALDPLVFIGVHLNPEVRVKVARGAADARLQQHGYTAKIIKIHNESTVTAPLRINSPQAGAVYGGVQPLTMKRMATENLATDLNKGKPDDRFIDISVRNDATLSDRLSGLILEYKLLDISSSQAGNREAILQFDVGEGTKDLASRFEIPVLFQIARAEPVAISVLDETGQKSVARLEIRDTQGRVYPSQLKRLAPDLFFQPQIYRADGDIVALAPGKYNVVYSRGPEYLRQMKEMEVRPGAGNRWEFQLKRWVNTENYGFYSGDHHIHAAGCSHYEKPTEGVRPEDMFPQVKGEGLNVGCILTWGPCYDFQRNYFQSGVHKLSEPKTLIKYDVEVSGFGSQALGHVCLLNLADQTYPGSDGTKDKGWPTWTTPVLRWTKQQGGVTGYPHSALRGSTKASAELTMKRYDKNGDQHLDAAEIQSTILPEPFELIDVSADRRISFKALLESVEKNQAILPTLAVPDMNGGGAIEIMVSTAEGVCDFISAMDTARIPEWNTWYHIMNAGFPLKVSGETDFPCMSSQRVGQGRVYVQLGKRNELQFADWIRGVQAGRSYVSDGYAHALEFKVNGARPGESVALDSPADVQVSAKVAFAEEIPLGVAYGNQKPPQGRRLTGDTIELHLDRSSDFEVKGTRLVELVVNGKVVESRKVPADGREYDLKWDVRVDRSSWVALRHFPQMHTNPVNVMIGGKPVRASRASALWCAESIRNLIENRMRFISGAEKEEALKTFQKAIATYEKIAAECPEGS
ncbi:MAG: CehA/McbA family metallohydrolase [Isosphaeraceae bacterium]